MLPRTTDDITDDPEKLRRSIKLTKIGIVIVLLLLSVNIITTLVAGPQPVSYAIAGIGLLTFIVIMWRGYLAWSKL